MTTVANTRDLFHASHRIAFGEHNRMFRNHWFASKGDKWICRCVRCGASARGIDKHKSEHDSSLEYLCPNNSGN